MSELATQAMNALSAIFEGRAHHQYGLTSVTQRAHALQCATQARRQHLPANLVVACLLHDVGHMIHSLGEHPAEHGVDDHHEALGADWLGQFFGPDVTEPVRLHVQAKRFLCATEPSYLGQLSADSVASLALQGGSMSDTEVAAFRMTPGWQEAVTLRRLDELAKDPHALTPEFREFADELIACLSARP